MASARTKTAVVTGASSGIGEATVRALAEAGYVTVAAARRLDRLRTLAAEVGGRAAELDVTDKSSVERLIEAVPEVDVLVHSAGGALGLDPVAEADEEQWREMYDRNVLGVMRVTKALLPALEGSGDGFVVVIGSVAGREVYRGGAGYNAAKHGASAVARALRLELLGKPIRVSEVAPGMVETEFSEVRFGGDKERAAEVYEGLDPLSAEDVADLITYVVTRPPHVDVDYVSIMPTAQATATEVHRD
jgi:NADP-dependent 3-hydroxy acid dehydrogenase YdfG